MSLGVGSRLDRTPEQTIAVVGEAAVARGVGVLLTVDEVQEAELFRPLIRAMHRAAQDDRPVGLIAAGLSGAAKALQEEGQTYTERLGPPHRGRGHRRR